MTDRRAPQRSQEPKGKDEPIAFLWQTDTAVFVLTPYEASYEEGYPSKNTKALVPVSAEVFNAIQRSQEQQNAAAQDTASDFTRGTGDAGVGSTPTIPAFGPSGRDAKQEPAAAASPPIAREGEDAVEALCKQLEATPNWLKEGYGDWKSCVSKYDRAPFEAAKQLRALRDELERVRLQAYGLWKLLDDIDTLDDACKENDSLFRVRAYAKQRERFPILSGEEWDKLDAALATRPDHGG